MLGSDRILFTLGSGLVIMRFSCHDPRILLLIKSPDNGAIDISAREELGHVAEQPEDQSGELRLIHHGCPPGHHRPLELRNLEMIVM